METHQQNTVCTAANGISGGCPFMPGLELGVCSDITASAVRLNRPTYVNSISCWKTPYGKAVGALKLSYANGVISTPVIGNEDFTLVGPTATLAIPANQEVQEIRMFYSAELDSAKRAQIGRIYIKLTGGGTMDCGDTSSPLSAFDMKVTGDEAGIGTMLVGATATSSVGGANQQPISINAINWIVLKPVIFGGVYIEPVNFNPKDVAFLPQYTNQDSFKISNAGKSTPMTAQCPEISYSYEQRRSYSNTREISSTLESMSSASWSHTQSAELSVGAEAEFKIFGIGATVSTSLSIGAQSTVEASWQTTVDRTEMNQWSQTEEVSNVQTKTYPSQVGNDVFMPVAFLHSSIAEGVVLTAMCTTGMSCTCVHYLASVDNAGLAMLKAAPCAVHYGHLL
jgi:hypothetical protein